MKKTLMELISHAAHDLALDAEVLRLIMSTESEDDRPTLLKTYLEQLHQIESDETIELPVWMDGEAGWKLRCEYGGEMERELFDLVRKNLPEEEFYRRLWLYISTTIAQEGFDMGVVALFRCTVLSTLPYVYLDPAKMVEMEKDEFAEIFETLSPTAIHEMRCILSSDLDQRTEQASLMLDLLDRYEGKKRVVLMAAILMETHLPAMRVTSLLDRLAEID